MLSPESGVRIDPSLIMYTIIQDQTDPLHCKVTPPNTFSPSSGSTARVRLSHVGRYWGGSQFCTNVRTFMELELTFSSSSSTSSSLPSLMILPTDLRSKLHSEKKFEFKFSVISSSSNSEMCYKL